MLNGLLAVGLSLHFRAVFSRKERSVMEEKMIPDPVHCNLPELSAEVVHKNILRCHYLRHRVDRKLLGWLFILIDRGFFKIHKSTPIQYVMDFLEYEGTEAGEVVRVAMAFPL